MNVHTSQIFMEGFTDPATANTEFAQKQLKFLHGYEQTLNQDPSNSAALHSFVTVSRQVSQNLKNQYGALWEMPIEVKEKADAY